MHEISLRNDYHASVENLSQTISGVAIELFESTIRGFLEIAF